MRGTVTESSFSSGGSPKGKIDGKWYFFPKGSDVASVVGKKIGFDEAQFQIEGKWFDSIKAWGILPLEEQNTPQAQAQPVQAVQAQMNTQAIAAGAERRQEALSSLYDHELRFISNVVGQAIYAGSCKTPTEIKAWFDAARDCLSDAPAAVDRTEQTKRAGEYVKRINEAINKGNDTAVVSIWNECEARTTGDDSFEAAVWSQLATPVRNRIKDLTLGNNLSKEEPPW
jgi:hypothetical protein